MAVKTYGYDRRSKVPALPRTTPKVCKTCNCWFAARPRESVCDGCVRPKERTLRALKDPPKPITPGRGIGRPNAQRNRGVKVVFSEPLGLTFTAKVGDPRATVLECRVLAYEEAARQRWKHGKAPRPRPVLSNWPPDVRLQPHGCLLPQAHPRLEYDPADPTSLTARASPSEARPGRRSASLEAFSTDQWKPRTKSYPI